MYEDIFTKIEESDIITIFGHIYPDGDCYGSTEGLKFALKHFYPTKKIYVVGTDFFRVPFAYPTADEVDDDTIKKSLAIICDLSNKARISDKRAFLSSNIIKIDHHIFTEEFGGLEYIDDKKGSCCDYLAEILYSKFDHLPPLVASLFFLGITTDTGRYLFAHNSDIFSYSARLIEDGAEVDKIYDALFETDEKSLKFKGYLFNSYKKTKLGVAYCVLSNANLKKYGYDKNSGAGFVNSIAHINASKLHVFFCEGEDGSVRVELRSSGDVNVQKIACKFNGGGHLNASGCVLSSLKDYKKVIRECEKELYKYFSPYSRELKTMLDLGFKASKIVMDYYRKGFDVEIKADDSPVTTADKASDKIIRDTLLKHYPNYGLLTEEEVDTKDRLNKDNVFIVDPLDGTKDFVAKDDMFAINIALVHKHVPVVGVVAIPAQNTIYFAVKGKGAYIIKNDEMIKQIRVSSRINKKLRALNSCFHKNEDLVNFLTNSEKVEKIDYVGSALKSCLIAEGKADVCYTLGQGTKEWDTCAPQIVLEEAGGIFISNKNEKIVYNREDVYNRDGFVALNKEENNIYYSEDNNDETI